MLVTIDTSVVNLTSILQAAFAPIFFTKILQSKTVIREKLLKAFFKNFLSFVNIFVKFRKNFAITKLPIISEKILDFGNQIISIFAKF
jgi:hypothetical protein